MTGGGICCAKTLATERFITARVSCFCKTPQRPRACLQTARLTMNVLLLLRTAMGLREEAAPP